MEIWKAINDCPDYQVSNYGNVKSLKGANERILKNQKNNIGYYHVTLCNNNIKTTHKIHVLVAIHFLNHIPCGHKLVVNHIDFDKSNNHADNLEIITQRKNSNQKHLPSTSKYIGVYWSKAANKWQAQIVINKKVKYLGVFDNEQTASLVYQKELTKIK